MVELCGIYPVNAVPVVLLTTFAVTELKNFVFGDASGADADNKPATNLKISETSVFCVKLLKYDPTKFACHWFEVGTPTFMFSAWIDWDTDNAYLFDTAPSGEFINPVVEPVISILFVVA